MAENEHSRAVRFGPGSAACMAIGAGAGTALGAASDDAATGLAMGIGIGLALGFVWDAERSRRARREVRQAFDGSDPRNEGPQ